MGFLKIVVDEIIEIIETIIEIIAIDLIGSFLNLIGYSVIPKEDLKQIKKDKEKYFKKYIDEHIQLNNLLLKELEERV